MASVESMGGQDTAEARAIGRYTRKPVPIRPRLACVQGGRCRARKQTTMKRSLAQAATAALLMLALGAGPARAADPVAVAVGDIACGANTPSGTDCVYARTADLAVAQSPSVALLLGDTQYENGELSDYKSYFNPTWGRLKAIEHPVLGNHEYSNGKSTGSGYWDYFDGVGQANGPAGARGQGYYSFDVGSWHIVSLNSN